MSVPDIDTMREIQELDFFAKLACYSEQIHLRFLQQPKQMCAIGNARRHVQVALAIPSYYHDILDFAKRSGEPTRAQPSRRRQPDS